MLYAGLAILAAALVTFVLGFAGILPGAAGVANVALLTGFILLTVTAVRTLPWHHLHHRH